MHWRFDPLFSIAVYHTRYTTPDPDTGESPRKAPDFTLEPSASTARRLRHLGWVCKQKTGACTVYGEKVFETDGTPVLRGRPAPGEGFTFILRLNNVNLLNETKPFVLDSSPVLIPNGNLPDFSGRSRLLYFDNRNPGSTPGSDELNLIADTVDSAQLGSRATTHFDFRNPKPGVSTLEFTPLAPQGLLKSFTINPLTRSAEIKLPENGYQLVQKPGNHTETIFLTPDHLGDKALGVVRIFEPAGGAGWEPHRRYKILFEKV